MISQNSTQSANELLNLLKPYGQEHLLAHWESLNEVEQEALSTEIQKLDLAGIKDLLAKTEIKFGVPQGLTPPKVMGIEEAQAHKERWFQMGIEALKGGKVAALLLAGGQGSRLGFDGPKGKFSIGLENGASLFELQAQRLLALGKAVGQPILWFVMTSEQNCDETLAFFKENNFWGLAPEQVEFFNQGQIPAISFEGQILLSAKSKINRVPDGNGGCFKAFAESGALAKAKAKGVEQVFIYGVDNALVRPCDPLFVGFHIDQKVPTSSKVVAKARPDEAVGVFYQSEQGPGVIEYSDLDPELAKAQNERGELLYNGANIATHLFEMSALESVAQDPLPYHVARKKIPFLDAQGQWQEPQSPNAFKFEQFLFDVFERLQTMALLEVKRSEEFAPVKNAEGKDSPESARELLQARDANWVEQWVSGRG